MSKANNSKGPVRKILLIAFWAALFGFAVTFAGLRIWMKSSVNKICDSALEHYDCNDKNMALMLLLKSDTVSLEIKNKAIWALGHLKDTNALPVLRELQIDSLCDHNRFVCQRELNRTIEFLERKRLNIMRFR